jgi:hypothetical protein
MLLQVHLMHTFAACLCIQQKSNQSDDVPFRGKCQRSLGGCLPRQQRPSCPMCPQNQNGNIVNTRLESQEASEVTQPKHQSSHCVLLRGHPAPPGVLGGAP